MSCGAGFERIASRADAFGAAVAFGVALALALATAFVLVDGATSTDALGAVTATTGALEEAAAVATC
jgi:hypothetical protein